MRWSLCALLLLLAPSLAFADPTVTFTTPADPKVTGPTITVAGTVTNAIGAPTVTVTGAVNSVPATVTQADPNDPNSPFTWTAQAVPLVFGLQTLTAVATDEVPSTSTPATLEVHPHLFIEVSDPNTPPSTPITTGRTGRRFTGKVDTDDPNDNNDPTKILFGLRGLTTPLDPNFGFDQFVKMAAGTNTVFLTAQDGNDPNNPDNTFATSYKVTRTVVCDDSVSNDPNFPPAIDPNDPKMVITDSFSYSVDRADDLPNSDPNDFHCDVRSPSAPGATFSPPIPHCTLRAAIQASNSHQQAARQLGLKATGDRITILPSHILLRRRGANENASATGDLDVLTDLRLIGKGRDVTTIDARGLGDRVMDVAPGVNLQLFDLSLIGGQAPPAPDPNAAQVGAGGCLRDAGTLLANNTAFLSCSATTAGGAILQNTGNAKLTCSIVARGKAKGSGGGIAAVNGAVVDLENSTLSLNTAGLGGGALAQEGFSGVQLFPTATLNNCTLTDNRSKLGGGALDLGANDFASINNTTFSGNRAKLGSTFAGSGEVAVANSILGDIGKFACDPNAPQTITSGGGNIERGDSCLKPPSANDLANTDPKLGGLASNSPTIVGVLPPTQRLLLGSPAIDFAGVQSACTPLDARDTERFDWPGVGLSDPKAQSPFCDSGSFELTIPGAEPQ